MIEKLRQSTPEISTKGPRIVHLDSPEADKTLTAISSETTRRILSLLHKEPCPPSQLAQEADCSLANVNYHLEKLEDAGLVRVVDTWYSEKGNEMQVYAPAEDPLVFVGDEKQTSEIKTILRRFLGAFGVLALASLLVQYAVQKVLLPQNQVAIIRKVAPAGQLQGIEFTPLPPGVLFFTGGTYILAVVFAWLYWTNTRTG